MAKRLNLLQTQVANVDFNFSEIRKGFEDVNDFAYSKFGYVYTGRRLFTQAATYTPKAKTRAILLRMVGGGGGGGGCSGSPGNFAFACGGWSGEYLEKWIVPTTLVQGGLVIIGTGGGGGVAASSGTTGGDTSVVIQGIKYLCKGGVGGLPMAFGAGAAVTGTPARATGSTTGDFNYAGAPEQGIRISGGAGWSGAGGSNPLGSGGQTTVVTGATGLGYGAGGSGSQANAASSTGGAGRPGLVLIEEYE